jgi:hypothetical protein
LFGEINRASRKGVYALAGCPVALSGTGDNAVKSGDKAPIGISATSPSARDTNRASRMRSYALCELPVTIGDTGGGL